MQWGVNAPKTLLISNHQSNLSGTLKCKNFAPQMKDWATHTIGL